MRNLKFIVGFTLTGFFLSLICGFFSHSKFLHVFLQALLFAIIFALLAIVISVLFDRFLNEGVTGTEGDISGENVSSETQSVPKKGSKVDFVIQDEDLPVSESENQFFVGENRQLLNDSDVNQKLSEDSSQMSQAKINGNEGFVPLQKESFENLTETEAKSELNTSNGSSSGFSSLPSSQTSDDNIVNKSGNAASRNNSTVSSAENSGSDSKNGDIDILPEMNEVSFEKKDEDTEVESPFVSSRVSSTSTGSSVDVDVKDASLMAKAISSILSGDS